MSVRVSTWVWHDTTATGNDLLVLLALADIADDNGVCWPTVAALAAKARLGRATIQRKISALIDGELVERIEREGYSNLYRIMVPWVPQDEAPQVPHGRDGGASRVRRGVPHGRDTEPSETRQDTSGGSAPRRRKPETTIPDEWKPSTRHEAFASQHDLDLPSEAFAFRAHAQANDRRMRDWDAAFSMWLSKSRQFARQRPAEARSQWDRAVPVRREDRS